MSKLDDKLLTSIKLEYPFPLSFAFFSMTNAEEMKARLDKSLELLECLIKYLTIISLSSFVKNTMTPELATFILSFLPRPSLGTWNAALREIMTFYHNKPEDLFLPEIYHFYFRANKKVSENARIIDNLISIRNRIAHGGGPSNPKDCEKQALEIQPQVEELLSNLSFLRDYDLLFLKYSKKEHGEYHHAVKICMGAFPQFENKEITTSNTENSNHMYLYHREKNGLLDLHPFMTYSDKFEGATLPEIFFYNRTNDNKINYMNFQGANNYNDAEVYKYFNEIIISRLNTFSKVKELKLDDYKKIVSNAWKFGIITEEDDVMLTAKKKELGITDEEAETVENDVKKVLFSSHMEELINLLSNQEKADSAIETILNIGRDAIPFLIKALEREALHDRLSEIFITMASDCVNPLIEALQNEKTRNGASKALKEMPNISVPVLIDELRSEPELTEIDDTLVFICVPSVNPLLGTIKLKEEKAMAGGMKLVTLKQDKVWVRAKDILIRIGKPATSQITALLSDSVLCDTASEIIKSIGSDSYDALIYSLSDSNLKDKSIAILKSFGISVIPRMMEELSSEPSLSPIVEEFILSQDSQVLPLLVQSLNNGVCIDFSISMLSHFKDDYPSLIVPLLGKEELNPIAENLLINSENAAVLPLVKSLSDPALSDFSEKILRKLPPSEVLKYLMEEIKKRDKGFLSYFSLSGKLETGMRSVISDLSKNKLLGSLMDTVKINKDAVNDVLKNLRDPFARKCISLIASLPAEVLDTLIDELEKDELFSFLRISFISSGEKTVPILLGAIPKKSEKTKDRLAVILSDIGAFVVPHLIDALPDDSKKMTAQKALVMIGPSAVPELAKSLIDDNLRESIITIISEIGPCGFDGYSQLLGAPVIGDALLNITLNMKDDIIPILIKGLENMAIRQKCLDILKKIGKRANSYLVESLKKENLYPFIADLLKASGPAVVFLLFEKYKSETGAVASLFKSIINLGRKDAAVSPVKKAIIDVSSLYPEALIELCLTPKNNELAVPLLSEVILRCVAEETQNDQAIKTINEHLKMGSITLSLKQFIESNREYKSSVISKALSLLNL